MDTTLFRKSCKKDFILVQIYVDDIIFGATNETLCKEFSELMQTEFEMSMMGELKFFLGIQIKQCPEGTYIHQTKYIKELLKKFKLEESKPMSTLMHPTCNLGKHESSKTVEQNYTEV